jgi:hypothetical protein
MPPPREAKEQQLLQHARREGLLIMAVWALVLTWSVGSGWLLGYDSAASARAALGLDGEHAPIFGIPAWVFVSVFVPWGLCLLFSIWFCFFHMADDDLGKDRGEGEGHG